LPIKEKYQVSKNPAGKLKKVKNKNYSLNIKIETGFAWAILSIKGKEILKENR